MAKNLEQICINDSCKFFKINISDECLKKIIAQYSNMYDFNGDGVILVVTKQNNDTTKYYLNLVLQKEFFTNWLSDKRFILFDTVANRIAIIYSGLESSFCLPIENGIGDTILNKYIHDYKSGGINEIWQLEYTRVNSDITRKVYYGNPF